MYSIRNINTDERTLLSADAGAVHPQWAHDQLGTEDEGDLRGVLRTGFSDVSLARDGEDGQGVSLYIPEASFAAWDDSGVVEIIEADDAESAARAYFEAGGWDTSDGPVFGRVETRSAGGEVAGHEFTLPMNEPDCEASEHDWQRPHAIVGGLAENPGVHGHGGGVVITEVCAHCGAYRVTDTWATNPVDGTEGHETVTYRDPDDRSRGWAELQQAPAYEAVDEFIVPPENGGQIVEVSYALGRLVDSPDADAVVLENTYDRNDGTTRVEAYEATETEFAPWNGVPALGTHIGLVRLVD